MYFHLEVPTNIYNIIIIFKIPLHKDLTIHIICCGEGTRMVRLRLQN